MTNVQGTAIIRNRGQLTIPEKIREEVVWAKPNSVVIILKRQNELLIRPYEAQQKEVDWDRIWKNLRKIRSFKTENARPASEIIAEDRYRH